MNITDRKWKNSWLEKKLESSWISDYVDHNLKKYFSQLESYPVNVLEVGCGDGLNSVFLSEHGCVVDALDVSDFALEIAKSKSQNINFICDDFITTTNLTKKYDFIFDKGCFHGTTAPDLYVKKISSLLTSNGVWFSIIGSAEGRDINDPAGPPKHKLTDLVNCIDPVMRILNVEATTLVHKKNIHSPAWKIISCNRP